MTLTDFENRYRLKDCCLFSGHRAVADRAGLKARISAEVENLINRGVTVYLSGGALGFDTLAAETVLEKKGKYPFVKLFMVLPCRDQDIKWSASDRAHYEEILKRADLVHYIGEAYDEGCMLRRNDFMVERSGTCIAYLRQSKGGTFYTVSYAKRMGRELILL
ncbi:MAG: DUF1273 family protein [Clostridia bacterium]|nr:DUF1273 family protein [Clostridia bacterium]